MVFKSKSSYIQTSTVHKLLKDIHEESITKTKTNQPVIVQPFGRAFEDVWIPRSVLQINIEDVRTSEQHRPDARSISIQQGICFQKSTLFGKSAIRPDDSVTRPDDVQYLQTVRTTWQHVQTISSSSDKLQISIRTRKGF